MRLFIIFAILLLAAIVAKKALDPRTRTHLFFCTRCRRRKEYMS